MKRQGHFREKKNNRLTIDKKLLNSMRTKEKNRSRKVLVVIQSLHPMVCKILILHSQSIITKSQLHLGNLTQLHSVKPSLSATILLLYGKFSQPQVSQQISTRDCGSFLEQALYLRAIYHHDLGRRWLRQVVNHIGY